MPGAGRGKSGARKIGRNTVSCEQYRRENRREKSKIRKLKRLIKKQPNNKELLVLLNKLMLLLKS